ncbi:RAxF-45 family protein [Cytobacillus purgationiresistens]|nr:RAxF-45 family protein [Cytobacillus purgationiresistens]
MDRRWEEMLNLAVLVHGFWTEYLFLNRAKFAALVVNGIRVPFFNNLIADLKR